MRLDELNRTIPERPGFDNSERGYKLCGKLGGGGFKFLFFNFSHFFRFIQASRTHVNNTYLIKINAFPFFTLETVRHFVFICFFLFV
ncbi:unnamed protein product [Meloidogyne enterolobii]|uniref:Uncharacterized protein n=1 Tax=Meloidogyne enterolobii TaxID=390850 RepID=A0ACB0ZTE0_MELEN